MSDLIERLRGKYVIPINDGAGPLDGSMEFIRQFPTPPIHHEAADALEANAKRIAELERLAPMCDDHGKGKGTRSGCPYCALVKQSSVFSQIDYLCGEPNTYNVSAYDLHCNEDAVFEAVKRKFAELEAEVARLRMDWHRLEFLNKNMRIQMATSVETRLYIDLPVATSFRAAIDAAKEQS